MSSSAPGRRDLLIAVSGGCITLAGCSDSTTSTTRTEYGAAYGREYGTE